MMSEISARLLKGYNISYSTSSVRGGDKRMSDFSSTSSSSSNSSSNEGQQRTPDPLRDVSSSRNSSKERFSNRDACFKRRKIDELRYAASQVKEDLEKGGLPFPSVHAKKPRALEGFDINMSNIRLLNAASVADSPFLTKLAGKRSFQSYSDVSKLCNETQNVYSQRWSQEDVSSDWDRSSAGSLTSDSEASCVVDIAPLLEDSLKYQSFETKATHPSTLAKVKTVSMATALENNNEARLITLSFAPFLIIHVNPAYARLTGIGAKDLLGKPLRGVFSDKRCKAMAVSVSSLASMHEQLTSVSTTRQDKRCNCSLKVSLVGATDAVTDNKPPNATHCMVAFAPRDSNFGSQPLVTSVPKNGSPHFEVIA